MLMCTVRLTFLGFNNIKDDTENNGNNYSSDDDVDNIVYRIRLCKEKQKPY